MLSAKYFKAEESLFLQTRLECSDIDCFYFYWLLDGGTCMVHTTARSLSEAHVDGHLTTDKLWTISVNRYVT